MYQIKKDNKVDFEIPKTVVFVRVGVLDDEVGLALLSTFEKAGAFMINNRDGMLTCDNKMSTYITFNQYGIQTPRTSIINNEESVRDAHKRIGGKVSCNHKNNYRHTRYWCINRK